MFAQGLGIEGVVRINDYQTFWRESQALCFWICAGFQVSSEVTCPLLIPGLLILLLRSINVINIINYSQDAMQHQSVLQLCSTLAVLFLKTTPEAFGELGKFNLQVWLAMQLQPLGFMHFRGGLLVVREDTYTLSSNPIAVNTQTALGRSRFGCQGLTFRQCKAVSGTLKPEQWGRIILS